MAPLRQFDLHPTKLERARLFWIRYANHPQVQERRRSNVEAAPRRPSAGAFWKELVLGGVETRGGMRAVVPLATLVPVTWGLEPR